MVSATANSREELAGYVLAICLHPLVAWRLVTPIERALILFAYFSAGYLTGFCVLIWAR